MRAGFGDILWPPIGIMLIDSVPPANMQWAAPDAIRSAAKAMDCNPDEQNRFNVIAGTE